LSRQRQHTWIGALFDVLTAIVLFPFALLIWLLNGLGRWVSKHPWVPFSTGPCSHWILSEPRLIKYPGKSGSEVFLKFQVRDGRYRNLGGSLWVLQGEDGAHMRYQTTNGKMIIRPEAGTEITVSADRQLMLLGSGWSRSLGRLECTEPELEVVRGFLSHLRKSGSPAVRQSE
jgi:hypothetical protein